MDLCWSTRENACVVLEIHKHFSTFYHSTDNI